MTRLRKWSGVFGGVLILVIIIVLVGGTWFVRRPWPQVSGTIAANGLTAPVQIMRDEGGIPSIYADNEMDLFFAQGYVHAQDRLWQMEFTRRLADGKLSAVLGEGTVSSDRYMRTLGLREAALQELDMLDEATIALLENYAAGVNEYIQTHTNRLPIEFTLLRYVPEPWEPLDTLMWGKLMSLTLGWNFPLELLRANIIAKVDVEAAQQLLPPYDDSLSINLPNEVNEYDWLNEEAVEEDTLLASWWRDAYRSKGSNNWVVSGTRTATGMPLLANDTHLAMDMPSIWYENGLYGGRFQSVGFTFPGVPLIIMGHNTDIAWSVTDMPVDAQDLYVETFNDPENPTQYKFMDQWHDLEIRSETIAVSGGEPVEFNVYMTRHGPIINDILTIYEATEPLALQWTVLKGANLFRGVLQLNLASNWTEFRQALHYWDAPNQHFVYADREGNIGYQAAGMVPLRADNHQGVIPFPGWTGAYEWQGFLDVDQHFSILNPDSGFIATANNPVAPDDYPHHLAYEWTDPYRIQRIDQLLSNDSEMTMDDMRNLQADTYSLPAEQLRPYILMVEPETDLQRAALDQLERWNLYTDIEQTGATIFQVWYWFMMQNLLLDELDERLIQPYWISTWINIPMVVGLMQQPDHRFFDNQATKEQETRDDIVAQSFTDAIVWLSENQGTDLDEWQWGDIHTITFSHTPFGQSGIGPLEWLFNSDPMAAHGDDTTINMGWVDIDGTFTMNGGVAQRMIIDLSDFDNSQTINSTGQSAHVWHPNREDAIALWRDIKYRPMHFSREQVVEHTKATLTLTPQSE